MDRPGIGSARDDPVKGINLAHKVPFAQSSNRRIAAHRSNRIKIETHQRNMRTHPRSRSRSFGITTACTTTMLNATRPR